MHWYHAKTAVGFGNPRVTPAETVSAEPTVNDPETVGPSPKLGVSNTWEELGEKALDSPCSFTATTKLDKNFPALDWSTVTLAPEAPSIIEQLAGGAAILAITAVSHRYQLISRAGAGKPAHVPPVAETIPPTRGFPVVAVGAVSVRLAGSRVIAAVEALTRSFDPESFLRVTSTAIFFPRRHR